MMTYCFAEEEGRHALFAEAALRGWLAAVQDFPQFKNHDGIVMLAQLADYEMQAEVCCIGANTGLYQSLIVSAWRSSYEALTRISEREIVLMASMLKEKSEEEAMSILRSGLESEDARAAIDGAYKQFLAQNDSGV